MSRSGSSIVLVLCVVSAITVLVTMVLRTSIFAYDLSLKRAQYEKQFWATSAYEQYAIAYLNQHAPEVLHNKSVINLPPVLFDHYHGTITLMSGKGGIDVSVQLTDEHAILQTVTFNYHFVLDDAGTQTEIAISNWRLE